mmetsp:Transcript_33501/g.72420  ORF Transcript_33501/g.72420 Transcript_33501/m.72420 type:complete len:273 (-) Transcript_33501:752-1570(-)
MQHLDRTRRTSRRTALLHHELRLGMDGVAASFHNGLFERVAAQFRLDHRPASRSGHEDVGGGERLTSHHDTQRLARQEGPNGIPEIRIDAIVDGGGFTPRENVIEQYQILVAVLPVVDRTTLHINLRQSNTMQPQLVARQRPRLIETTGIHQPRQRYPKWLRAVHMIPLDQLAQARGDRQRQLHRQLGRYHARDDDDHVQHQLEPIARHVAPGVLHHRPRARQGARQQEQQEEEGLARVDPVASGGVGSRAGLGVVGEGAQQLALDGVEAGA